jgi:hypothetical protein
MYGQDLDSTPDVGRHDKDRVNSEGDIRVTLRSHIASHIVLCPLEGCENVWPSL